MSVLEQSATALRSSTTAKLFLLALLGLLLLIPLAMVHALVQERASLAREAEGRIAAGWGGEQRLLLPMLRLDYVAERIGKDGELLRERAQHWLAPVRAEVEAGLEVESRRLGIHALPVYRADLKLHGAFDTAESQARLDPSREWNLVQASLLFAPGDLTGLREIQTAKVGGRPVALRPSPLRLPVSQAGWSQRDMHSRPLLLAEIEAPAGGELGFELKLELAGARELQVIPNSADVLLRVAGDWPHPGFAGGMLPRQRAVGEAGFEAEWKLLDISTGMPTLLESSEAMQGWASTAVGVRLVEPGGLYQQNDRSAKYGALLLALTILALFLSEVLVRVRLHPFHYALIGMALALFYLLLLALSEHLGFVLAWLLAAAMVVLMVGGYATAVLGGWRRGLLAGGLLTTMYGFLYVLIQAEELSLLLGALGLALLLALTMYLTRRFDWYSAAPLQRSESSPAP